MDGQIYFKLHQVDKFHKFTFKIYRRASHNNSICAAGTPCLSGHSPIDERRIRCFRYTATSFLKGDSMKWFDEILQDLIEKFGEENITKNVDKLIIKIGSLFSKTCLLFGA